MSASIKEKFLDILERAGWSAAQQFLALILVGGALSFGQVSWIVDLSTAAGAFIVSALLSIGQLSFASPLTFWPDLIVRIVKTFAASLVGLLGADVVNVIGINWVADLQIAGFAAFLALVKGLLGPHTTSPSTLRQPPPAALGEHEAAA